jgi:hypothetical protein
MQEACELVSAASFSRIRTTEPNADPNPCQPCQPCHPADRCRPFRDRCWSLDTHVQYNQLPTAPCATSAIVPRLPSGLHISADERLTRISEDPFATARSPSQPRSKHASAIQLGDVFSTRGGHPTAPHRSRRTSAHQIEVRRERQYRSQ